MFYFLFYALIFCIVQDKWTGTRVPVVHMKTPVIVDLLCEAIVAKMAFLHAGGLELRELTQ
jgi:short subunit fatty acids transporter